MLFYYLKETFNSLFRSKLGSLLVIVTTAIAISFVTLSVGLVVFSNLISNKLKSNIKINLFVSAEVKSLLHREGAYRPYRPRGAYR